MTKTPYFWRTQKQQEIDLVEECDGRLSAFVFPNLLASHKKCRTFAAEVVYADKREGQGTLSATNLKIACKNHTTNNNMRKSVLLIALCLVAGAWFSVMSATDYVTGNLPTGKWSYNPETKELYIDAVTVPGDDRVEAYKGGIFFPRDITDKTVKVTLSAQVETIDRFAFYGFASLKEVDMAPRDEEKKIVVGYAAFKRCRALEKFDFSHVSELCDRSFEETGFKTLELRNIEKIGWYSFLNCTGLERDIPDDIPYGTIFEPSVRILGPQPLLTYEGEEDKRGSVLVGADPKPGRCIPIFIPTGYKKWTQNSLDNPHFLEVFFIGGELGTNPVTGETAWWYKININGRGLLVINGAFMDFPEFASRPEVPWGYGISEDIHIYGMKRIPPYSFWDYRDTERVYLQGTETSIGKYAFAHCSSLVEINVNHILSFDEGAFHYCVNLPALNITNAESIGDKAFKKCARVAKLHLGERLTHIGDSAFADWMTYDELHRAEIHVCAVPPTGGHLGKGVFADAFADLTTLHVPATYESYYQTEPWNIFKQEVEIPYPIAGDGWTLENPERLVITKSEVLRKNYTPTEPAPWNYVRDYIDRVMIEKSAGTEIGDYAFNALPNLTSVTIASGCTRVGKNAFAGCKTLKDIRLQDGDGSLDGVIDDYAFYNCAALKQLKFGKNLTSIGARAFEGCEGLGQIFCHAQTPPAIQANSFDVPEVILLSVPQEVLLDYIMTDYWNEFAYKSDGGHGDILSAGHFYDGYYILYDDNTLYCYATEKTGTADIFGVNKDYYSPFVESVVVEGDISELDSCFRDMTSLDSVTFKTPVRELQGTFKRCSKLRKVDWPFAPSLQLRDSVFFKCKKLSDIDLSHVTYVGEQCFAYCNGLKAIEMQQVDTIRDYAFMECDGLENADISHAKVLGQYLFWFCNNLQSAKLNAISIGSGTFEQCPKFTTVHLGRRVAIMNAPFFGTSLSTIYYTRPYPAGGSFNSKIFETKDGKTKIDVTKISLYVPKASIDMFKKFDEWKDMNIKEDESLAEGLWSLPTSGYFFDSNSHWELDDEGNLNVYIKGEQAAMPWYSDGFDPVYEHPLQIWMPYFDNINIIGEDANVMFRLIPSFGGFGDAYEGVKSITIGSGVKHLKDFYGPQQHSLKDVYCWTEDVPEGDDAFTWTQLKVGTQIYVRLHVLAKAGVKEKYEKHPKWSKFPEIIADLGEATYMVSLESMYGSIKAEETDVDLNAVPEGTTLHLTAVPDNGYEFVRWENYDPETGLEVTDNITVTAVFQLQTFSVIFQDEYGLQIGETQQVTYGEPATAPEAPAVEGYHFIGWDRAFDHVTDDIIVIAMYDINLYTVQFVDKYGQPIGETLETEHGTSVIAPEAPIVEGYHFIGWDKPLDNITEDMTVHAVYAEDIYYTVTFYDRDGDVLFTETVEEGKDATAPVAPVREGWHFTGWDTDFTNVQSDLTVTALYELNTHRLIVKAKNGAVYVEYDPDFLAALAPRRSPDGDVTWDNAHIDNLDIMPYGHKFLLRATPDEGYEFQGWGADVKESIADEKANPGALTMPDMDVAISAIFEKKTYTVTFYDHEDNVLSTQTVKWNEQATAPDAPAVEGYTFTGWDKDFEHVTSDMIVTAQYQKDPATGLEDTQRDGNRGIKVIRNGILYIQRDGKTYNAQGATVK